MAFGDFLRKQFIDVIQWTEPEDGILSYRFPIQDAEIQMGGSLTVRESQMAAFVNEGKIADVFGPGRYTLSTENLPVLTNLMNWDKFFESPFKSDVYFFSSRLQLNQRWGTTQPVTIRDSDFGVVRLRGFGTYAYRVADVPAFHTRVSGTREIYRTADLDGQLRNIVVSGMAGAFASSGVPFLDMAANQGQLAIKIAEQLQPSFRDLGLELTALTVESLSLPDELQKRLDERIGMNMVGNLAQYTQYQVAQSMPIAAANPGGGAGLGAGLGAGMAMGQAMVNAITPGQGGGNSHAPGTNPGHAGPPPAAASQAHGGAAPSEAGGGDTPAGMETKFCMHCGQAIPRGAKFCAECGGKQE